MYLIKENVDLNTLRDFGFRIGKEYPDNDRCICNESDRDDYWLIPFDLEADESGKILYADEEFDQPLWSIHVQNNRRVWVECVPSCTYHIGGYDLEPMLHALRNMILAGIVDDDYDPNENDSDDAEE